MLTETTIETTTNTSVAFRPNLCGEESETSCDRARLGVRRGRAGHSSTLIRLCCLVTSEQ